MNLGGPGQHPERPDAAGRVLTVWGSMRNRMSDSTLHWFSMIQPRWADCTEVVIFGGLCKPTVNMLKWSAIVLWAPPWIGWFLASKHDCSWCNQHLQKRFGEYIYFHHLPFFSYIVSENISFFFLSAAHLLIDFTSLNLLTLCYPIKKNVN